MNNYTLSYIMIHNLDTGAPVVDGRGFVAPGDRPQRREGRDHGWHTIMGAILRANSSHGKDRAPAAIPHGHRLQDY